MSVNGKKRRKRQLMPQRRPYNGPPETLGVPPGRGAAPGTVGQAPFVATPEQRQKVKALVACDFTNTDIAISMRIPQATLERHFREELSSGKTEVFAAIAQNIIQGAMEGDRTFAIYASKARMGWRERSASVSASQGNGDAPAGTTFTISITG